MDEEKSWLRANWRTAVALVLIFGIALFLRFYFVVGLAFPSGIYSGGADYSGGSDSFYWERAIKYTFDSGKDLGGDYALNYPIGNANPRPPLFPWFAVLMGRLIAPVFGDAWTAVVFVFLSESGLFGALTIFPTYLLTKEAFGRRAGLVAALFLAISAAHLQRSQATDADHDAFTLFFVVSTFYLYLRALKVLKPRRWVENWFQPSTILAGVRTFFRENPKSVLYAALSGLCITAIALAWQGWAYVPVILLVLFAVELFLDRLRNQDTMAVTILFTIVLITPVVLAFPWYYGRGQIRVWFDVPGYLFVVALVLGAVFTFTRDYPWTLVIPSTLLAGGAGLGVGLLVNPALTNAFVSGAGYFVQTKVVSTIAEAQAPGLSQLILSFGWFTFYFSLAAVAYMLWQIPRRHDPAYTMIAIWVFASIFMAMSAARFIFNASPAFAVAAAYAVEQILVRADFAGMRRSYRSLVDGSWRNAIRKSVKVRHIVTVLMLAGIVLLPNVWFGIDAAIPYELKSTYDRQVNDLLPSFLRAPGYSQQSSRQSTFYFGAFGYSLPQATEYYPAAWKWFQGQDTSVPLEERPAFLSWWDYGFEAVDRGDHPTVADNFQNGVNMAGQFITAQSEAQAIALLSVQLLFGAVHDGHGTFPPAVAGAITDAGLSPSQLLLPFRRATDYVPVVLDNPLIYGPWAPDLQPGNAVFIYVAHLLTSAMSEDRLVQLYHGLRDATGYDIGYFAIDSRLFPISVQNTGIFYAPVKLSDHRVINLPDGRVLPFEFFQIFADTNRGTRLPLQFVQPGDQISSETIEYQPMFYNSMFYRAYVGYAPSDLNSTDKGIPGFSQALSSTPPVPAWNLTHFRVVYRTAYYNPYTDVGNHTDAWRAMDYVDALQLQKDISAGKVTGVVDLSTQASITNGVVFLRYYDGAWVNGTVTAGGTTPLQGVRITVTDELGTPHYVTTTDADGRYSALVPFGDITLTASLGDVTPRTLIGANVLTSTTLPVTLDQALRVHEDLDGDGIVDWTITRNLVVPGRQLRGTAYFDLNNDGSFNVGDTVVRGTTVTLSRTDFPLTRTFTTASDGTFALGPLPDGAYQVTLALAGRTFLAPDLAVSSSTEPRRDLSVPYTRVYGFASTRDLTDVGGATIQARDETNGTVFQATTGDVGLYEFAPLLTGNYTITGDRGDLAALPLRIGATQGTTWANLTFVPSGRVVGTTRLFGTDWPDVTLDFQAVAEPTYTRTVTSDGTGAFAVTLPAAEWDVNGRMYSDGVLYATLGRLTVAAGAVTSYDAMFVNGVRINGTVRLATAQNPTVKAPITFLASGAEWQVNAGPDVGYLAFLPVGTYDIQASTTSSANYLQVSLASSRPLDLSLYPGTLVSGTVYRDMNGNGFVDLNEEIFGARLALTDDAGHRILAVSNATGGFSFIGFSNRTYAGSFSASGYADRTVLASTPAPFNNGSPYALSPLPIAVQGSILLNGSPLLFRSVTVRAQPLGGGAVTASTPSDSNGGFTLNLIPGTYELLVDENVSSSQDWRYQNLGRDQVVLAVGGAAVNHDIAIVSRARVTGNVTIAGNTTAGLISFTGPDQVSANATVAGFTVYLQQGTYAMSANGSVGADVYGRLDTVTISSPANLTFALVRAAQVSGRLTYDGVSVAKALPIAFSRQEGGSLGVTSASQGTYTAYLVPGSYQVTIDAATTETQGSLTRYVRYAASASLTVPSGTTTISFDIALARSLDNTTILGNATLSGLGVDASLSFLARGGGAIAANVSSASDGSYSVGLAPGSYDIYVTRALGSGAFLGSFTLGHAASRALNLALQPGFTLSGVVTDYLGARTTTTVTIASTSKIDVPTDASGAYAALLPKGTYVVTTSKSGTERGMAIRYIASTTIDLTGDEVANLPLEKVVDHAAKLTWDASQRQLIAGGQSVTYTLQVANTGNVQDTFTFSSPVGNWNFLFVPSSLALNYGNADNRTFMSVTITPPTDALVEHGGISINAATPDGVTRGTVQVMVDILRVRGLSMSIDPTSATFDGRFLNYTVNLANKGNAQENVTVLIGNSNDLVASGWSARLGRTTGPATFLQIPDVSVLANSTNRVRLVVQSIGGASGASIVLQAYEADAPGVSSTVVQTLSLPALQEPGGIQVTGPLVTRQPPLNMELVAILAAAASAVAAGYVLTRRRR